MGFQPSPKLSTTDGWWAEMWWKRVPDGCGCNMETPSTKLCSCRIMALPNEDVPGQRSDASDWNADNVKVGRTVLTDTVKHRDCYFKLYSLLHCGSQWSTSRRAGVMCSYLKPQCNSLHSDIGLGLWWWGNLSNSRSAIELQSSRRCTHRVKGTD